MSAKARRVRGRKAAVSNTSSVELAELVTKLVGASPAAGLERTSTASAESASARTETLALKGFELAANVEISLPAEAYIVGEPVTITKIHAPGPVRVGLVASCKRNEQTYEMNLADVVFQLGSAGAELVARYRSWLGWAAAVHVPQSVAIARAHKLGVDDISIGMPVELVVLACKSNALRCRVCTTAREVTLRTAVGDEFPGAIITVLPRKLWTHARHQYVSGEVTAQRVDVSALGLMPLALNAEGEWNPQDEYWGEDGEPIDAWAEAIIARGKRPMFELSQVIPGADPEDFDADPIVEASERHAAGDSARARELLMSLLAQDLRCLDAHAHLGNIAFTRRPKQALDHYEMGVRIGMLSLGEGFDGVLPWGLIDNRPFLRCLNGKGLCAWRLDDLRAAATVFREMLWLNPSDNQGARFNLAAVEAGKSWEQMQ